jgi:DNA-binding NarL/FixJ family response regulator
MTMSILRIKAKQNRAPDWHKNFCKISRVMRVLIADDQKSVGTTLASLVTHCHHEVVEVVGSGFEAIQAYSRHRPDVVLMDYWMSKLNGATACRNILAKHPEARVILVSGFSPYNELIDAGAIAVLPKPVHLDRLDQLLKSIEEQPDLDFSQPSNS